MAHSRLDDPSSVRVPKKKEDEDRDRDFKAERKERKKYTRFVALLRIITLTPAELMMLLVCNTHGLIRVFDEQSTAYLLQDNMKCIKAAQQSFAAYAKVDAIIIPGFAASVSETSSIMSFEQVLSVYNAAILLFEYSKGFTAFFLFDETRTMASTATHLIMAMYCPKLLSTLNDDEVNMRATAAEYSEFTRMVMDLIPRREEVMLRGPEIAKNLKTKIDLMLQNRRENREIASFEKMVIDQETKLEIEPQFHLLAPKVAIYRSIPSEPDVFFEGDLDCISRPGVLVQSLISDEKDFPEAREEFAAKFAELLKDRKCTNYSVDRDSYAKYCSLAQHYTHIAALLPRLRFPGTPVKDQRDLNKMVLDHVYRDPLTMPTVLPIVNPLLPMSHNFTLWIERHMREVENLSHNSPEGALVFLLAMVSNLSKMGEDNWTAWIYGGGGSGKTHLLKLLCHYILGDVLKMSNSNTEGTRLAPVSRVVEFMADDELADLLSAMVYSKPEDILERRGRGNPYSDNPKVPPLRSSNSVDLVRNTLNRKTDYEMYGEEQRVAHLQASRFTSSNKIADYLDNAMLGRTIKVCVPDGVWDPAIAAFNNRTAGSKRAAAHFKKSMQAVFHYSNALNHVVDQCGLGTWQSNLYSRNIVLTVLNSIIETSETLSSIMIDEGIHRAFADNPGFAGPSSFRAGAQNAGSDQNMQKMLDIITRNTVNSDASDDSEASIIRRFAQTRSEVETLFQVMRSHKPLPVFRTTEGEMLFTTRMMNIIFRMVERFSRLDTVLSEVALNVHGVSYTTHDAFAKTIPRIEEAYAFDPVHVMLSSALCMNQLDSVIPDVFVILGAMLAYLIQKEVGEGKEPKPVGDYYRFLFFMEEREVYNRRQLKKGRKDKVIDEDEADEKNMVEIPKSERLKFFIRMMTKAVPSTLWQRETIVIKMVLATTWGTLSSDGSTIIPFLDYRGFLGENPYLCISKHIGDVVDTVARAFNDVICSMTRKPVHGLTGLSCFANGTRSLQAAAFARRYHRTTDSHEVKLPAPYDQPDLTIDTIFRKESVSADMVKARTVNAKTRELVDSKLGELEARINDPDDLRKKKKALAELSAKKYATSISEDLSDLGKLATRSSEIIQNKTHSAMVEKVEDLIEKTRALRTSSTPSPGVDSARAHPRMTTGSSQRERSNGDFSQFAPVSTAVSSSSAAAPASSSSSSSSAAAARNQRAPPSSSYDGDDDDLGEVMIGLGIRPNPAAPSPMIIDEEDDEGPLIHEATRKLLLNRSSSAPTKPRRSASVLMSSQQEEELKELQHASRVATENSIRDAERKSHLPTIFTPSFGSRRPAANASNGEENKFRGSNGAPAMFPIGGKSAHSHLTVGGRPINSGTETKNGNGTRSGNAASSSSASSSSAVSSSSRTAEVKEVRLGNDLTIRRYPHPAGPVIRVDPGNPRHDTVSHNSNPSPMFSKFDMSDEMEALYDQLEDKLSRYITEYQDGVFMTFMDYLEKPQASKHLLAEYRAKKNGSDASANRQAAAASSSSSKSKKKDASRRSKKDRALELLDAYTVILDKYPPIHTHFMDYYRTRKLAVVSKSANDARVFANTFMKENNLFGLTMTTYPACRVAAVARANEPGRFLIKFPDTRRWDNIFEQALPPLFAPSSEKISRMISITQAESGGRTAYSNLNMPDKALMTYNLATMVEQRKLQLRYGEDLYKFVPTHPDRIDDAIRFRHQITELMNILRPVYSFESAQVDETPERDGQLRLVIDDIIPINNVEDQVTHHSNKYLPIPLVDQLYTNGNRTRHMYAEDVFKNLAMVFVLFFQYMRFQLTLHGLITPVVDYAYVLRMAHSLGIVWFTGGVKAVYKHLISEHKKETLIVTEVIESIKEYLNQVIFPTQVASYNAFAARYDCGRLTEENCARLITCLNRMGLGNHDLANCIYIPLPDDIPMTTEELAEELCFDRSLPLFKSTGSINAAFVREVSAFDDQEHLNVEIGKKESKLGDHGFGLGYDGDESDSERKSKKKKKKGKKKKGGDNEPDDGVDLGSEDTDEGDDPDDGDYQMVESEAAGGEEGEADGGEAGNDGDGDNDNESTISQSAAKILKERRKKEAKEKKKKKDKNADDDSESESGEQKLLNAAGIPLSPSYIALIEEAKNNMTEAKLADKKRLEAQNAQHDASVAAYEAFRAKVIGEMRQPSMSQSTENLLANAIETKEEADVAMRDVSNRGDSRVPHAYTALTEEDIKECEKQLASASSAKISNWRRSLKSRIVSFSKAKDQEEYVKSIQMYQYMLKKIGDRRINRDFLDWMPGKDVPMCDEDNKSSAVRSSQSDDDNDDDDGDDGDRSIATSVTSSKSVATMVRKWRFRLKKQIKKFVNTGRSDAKLRKTIDKHQQKLIQVKDSGIDSEWLNWDSDCEIPNK